MISAVHELNDTRGLIEAVTAAIPVGGETGHQTGSGPFGPTGQWG